MYGNHKLKITLYPKFTQQFDVTNGPKNTYMLNRLYHTHSQNRKRYTQQSWENKI